MTNQKYSIPKSIEIEEVVLGAMIVDNRTPDEAIGLLKDGDMFFDTKHRYIFAAILSLYHKKEAIDLMTVIQEMKHQGSLETAGGDYEVIKLTQKASTSAHLEHHCRILQQYWIRRKMIEKSDLIRKMAFDDETDSLELIHQDGKMLDEINELLDSGRRQVSYSDALDLVEKRVELISGQKEGEFTGQPTGFRKIDKFTGGWQPSDLIIIAARPGMGKTALALKGFLECGKRGIPAAFFSLEMSTQQLATRTVAIDSNFHLTQLMRDGFEKDKYFVTLRDKTTAMKRYPLYIDDTASQDIRDIIGKARIWKRKYDIQILFVDYIQLATDRTKGNNREQEIASISRNLKMLAKELNIPVIALSQLSRSVETRQDKRPMLKDLRESGAIEQDADIVTFLYREHYYNPDAELPMDLTNIGANAEFSFAKYRSGSLETKGLLFDPNKVKYMDPEELDDMPVGDPATAFGGPDNKDDNPF